jgi:hypothetical protein
MQVLTAFDLDFGVRGPPYVELAHKIGHANALTRPRRHKPRS